MDEFFDNVADCVQNMTDSGALGIEETSGVKPSSNFIISNPATGPQTADGHISALNDGLNESVSITATQVNPNTITVGVSANATSVNEQGTAGNFNASTGFTAALDNNGTLSLTKPEMQGDGINGLEKVAEAVNAGVRSCIAMKH